MRNKKQFIGDLTLPVALRNSLTDALHCKERKSYNLCALTIEQFISEWAPSRILWLRGISKKWLAVLAHAIEDTGLPGTREWARQRICPTCGKPYLAALKD